MKGIQEFKFTEKVKKDMTERGMDGHIPVFSGKAQITPALGLGAFWSLSQSLSAVPVAQTATDNNTNKWASCVPTKLCLQKSRP